MYALFIYYLLNLYLTHHPKGKQDSKHPGDKTLQTCENSYNTNAGTGDLATFTSWKIAPPSAPLQLQSGYEWDAFQSQSLVESGVEIRVCAGVDAYTGQLCQ